MGLLGVVTGLKREAACLAGAEAAGRLMSGAAGGRPARARNIARDLLARGCTGLLSFGVAGGLERGLKCGDIVVAAAVGLDPEQTIRCDKDWRRALATALRDESLRPIIGPITGSDEPAATVDEKMRLQAATAALAVDQESHAVAYEARVASVPFLAVRVIADPWDRPVPWSVLEGLASDGSTRPGSVATRLLRRPWELPAVLAVARDFRRATERLDMLAGLGDGTFCFPVR